ncbi:ATP-binding response regulator [Limnoglobus roseus]|uniref:ATP-binding protein n=1 Tax=Limnoglobus roseus TaxID=2598579 RepID=A0A5C1AN22_9BACT|nr:response regulator [Limnoglobus roseus]QEL19122.1 ATP-binding protein [Limnoglobus roseus]
MPGILVVDDSTEQLHHLERILAAEGYRVLHAHNAADALAAVRAEVPDAVISDIHMPGMDGLELVAALREEVPSVPVLVMTEFGSEELAVRALKAGASNYLPKRNLERDVLEVLDELLSVASSQAQQAVFLGRMTSVEHEFVIENNPDLVGPVVSHVESMMRQMRQFEDSERMQVGVAVHEAVVNAIVHGNLEISSELKNGDWDEYHATVERRGHEDPYQRRRVTITVRATREPMLMVRVKDEGRGYNPTKVCDPTEGCNIDKGSGRGLLLIRTFFDTVTHSSGGNEITMVKRRPMKEAIER